MKKKEKFGEIIKCTAIILAILSSFFIICEEYFSLENKTYNNNIATAKNTEELTELSKSNHQLDIRVNSLETINTLQLERKRV